jgi:AcrR family transcriptional regulator
VTERDARGQIRLAAERLIAEHGVDVPLRDIALAAGQRNNSAVQYHFGSRDDLIAAVVQHRNEALEARRLVLLAELESTPQREQVKALIEVLVAPMLEIPYLQGATHYARFLEQVRNHPSVAALIEAEAGRAPAMQIILTRLERELTDLPPLLRRLRLTSLASTMFALLADRERAVESSAFESGSPDLAAANVVDLLVGVLTTPASPAALAAASGRRRARTA